MIRARTRFSCRTLSQALPPIRRRRAPGNPPAGGNRCGTDGSRRRGTGQRQARSAAGTAVRPGSRPEAASIGEVARTTRASVYRGRQGSARACCLRWRKPRTSSPKRVQNPLSRSFFKQPISAVNPSPTPSLDCNLPAQPCSLHETVFWPQRWENISLSQQVTCDTV